MEKFFFAMRNGRVWDGMENIFMRKSICVNTSIVLINSLSTNFFHKYIIIKKVKGRQKKILANNKCN